MSLRHAFPEVQLPELRKEAEPTMAVPAMRKPSEVKFRTGRDLKEIAEMMSGRNVVRVVAAVGAGKSTMLPRELVLATGSPLLHVVPSRLLAVAQYDYLSAKYTDMEYVLSVNGDEDYSATGITVTTSAAVCARLLKNYGTDNALGNVVVFMDESHESDAYTYALHKLAHVIPGVKGVVFASANHTPEQLPMRETPGDIVSERYSPKHTPKTWDPHDIGKPWSMSSFSGSVLMFVEPNSVANKLVTAYTEAGATAYRLTAKMEISVFRKAYADCMDPGSGIVVLIADYSFRSGFTFDVTTIVDCGVVKYEEVEAGSQKMRFRQAYEIERYQAQGRGGRTPGSKCICYYPEAVLEASLCNLESLEMDAAAVIFRCLGYAVPSELRVSKFATGKIPVDLVYSFNDTTALLCQPETAMRELVYVSESTAQKRADDEMASVVNSYLESPNKPGDLYSGLSVKKAPEAQTRMADAHDLLHTITSVAAATASISPPSYYMVPGLKSDVISTRLYGEDIAKCVDEIKRHPDMVSGYTNSDVREIIAMLLNAYNMLNATVIGLSFAGNYEEELTRASAMYPSLTKNWAEQLQERIRVNSNKLNVYAGVLNELKPSSMHYVMVEPFHQMEDKIAKSVAGQLIDAIKATSRKLDASAYEESMLARVDIPGFRPVKQEMLEISGGDVETAKSMLVPCRVNRRAMWVIHVQPNDTDRWDVNDFVDACAKVIEKANVSASSIADIVLPSYVSRAKVNRVIGIVKNGSYRRVERTFQIRGA